MKMFCNWILTMIVHNSANTPKSLSCPLYTVNFMICKGYLKRTLQKCKQKQQQNPTVIRKQNLVMASNVEGKHVL
jgi:hypothetical protein